MKEKLHFAHGNGFPSPCYRQLLEGLEPRFDCFYIDKVGHSEAFPVTDNWHYLVDEVLQSILSQTSEPVVALGHSLGGVLSLLAAIEAPQLFKCVILLDSPLLGRIKSSLVRLSKVFGMIDRITPALRTQKRCTHWKTKQQALSYLKSRDLFKRFTEACLDDYIEYGMQKTVDGYSLRFDRDIEYRIYRTIPHVLKKYEGRLKVPTQLIYGNQSDVIDCFDLRYMKRKYGISAIETNGTHMFPMEHPKECARLVMDVAMRR